MGFKQIEAKRTELVRRAELLAQLAAVSDKINAQVSKLAAEESRLDEARGKIVDFFGTLASELDKIDTVGVPEFEQYRTSLAAQSTGQGRIRALPTKPLQAAMQRARAGGDPDLAAKADTLAKLTTAADKLNSHITAFEAAEKRSSDAQSDILDALKRIAEQVEQVDAGDVREFVHYKESLVAMLAGRGRLKPLPIKPLQVVVARMKKDIDADFGRWLDKHAARLPKEITAGMVIADVTGNAVYEIKSGPKPSGDRNATGDAAIVHSAIMLRQGKVVANVRISKKELTSRGMKLIQA